jgi:hypothetical protein
MLQITLYRGFDGAHHHISDFAESILNLIIAYLVIRRHREHINGNGTRTIFIAAYAQTAIHAIPERYRAQQNVAFYLRRCVGATLNLHKNHLLEYFPCSGNHGIRQTILGNHLHLLYIVAGQSRPTKASLVNS